MASATLTGLLPRYPVGTTLTVYRQPAGALISAGRAPAGSSISTGTVSSTGTATFTGLASAQSYVAYALVNSEHRYTQFTADPTEVFSVDADGVFSNGEDGVLLRSRNALNVMDYGAVGDGVADDTEAIQAAIDAAHDEYVATGRRQTVSVPKDHHVTYNTEIGAPPGGTVPEWGALVLKSGVQLDGLGCGRLLADPVPTTTTVGAQQLPVTTLNVASAAAFPTVGRPYLQLQFVGTDHVVAYTGKTATSFTGAGGGTALLASGTLVAYRAFSAIISTSFTESTHDFSIRGLTIDGGNTEAIELPAHGVHIGLDAYNFDIDRCEFTHLLGKAIELSAETSGTLLRPHHFQITRNFIHDIASNAVGYSSGAYDFLIADNIVRDNTAAVNGTGAAEAFISGSQTNIDRGTVRGNIVTNYGDISGGGRDMLIMGNTIVLAASCVGPGIMIGVGERVRVVDNLIDCSATSTDASHGIKASDGALAGLTIARNTIKRAVGAGVSARASGSTNVSILDNTVYNGSSGVQYDIDVGSATGVLVRGNRTTYSLAINVQSSSSRVTIAGNETAAGVLITGATAALIQGNDVDAPNGNTGIRATGASCLVTGNRVKNNSTAPNVAGIQINGAGCRVTGNVVENANSFARWIEDSAGSTFTDNTFIGTNGNVSLHASSTVKRNKGYVTENSGTASVADGGTIAHGLSTTPTRITLTAAVASRFVSGTAGSANITVALKDSSAVAVAVAETVNWSAEV